MMRWQRRAAVVLVVAASVLPAVPLTTGAPAGAAADRRVIGMTSGGGSRGNGVVLSPGVGSGPGVRQSITISATLSNVQCSGFTSTSPCPTGGTLTAALTSGPMSCDTLATQTTIWRGELTIVWSGGATTAETVVAPYKITLPPGIFYATERGTVAGGLQVLGTESGADTFTPQNGGCGTSGAPLQAMTYVAQIELRSG